MSWCGSASMSIWDDVYLSPCFIDTFGYISVLVYFIIVGTVRLHQIQKYQYSKNVPRTGIHIYELLSSALLLFILFVISIVQFANSELTFSSGLAKLMTGATWVYSMYLQQMEYGRSLKHNWAIKSYWLLLFLVESIQLQSFIKHRDFGAGFVGCLLIFVDLTALCITTLFSQADPPLAAENYNEVALTSPEDREALDSAVNSELWADESTVRSPQARRELKSTQVVAPEVRASMFKRLTYAWILPMLRRGYRRALTFADLPPLAITHKTHYVSEVLDHFWQQQLSRPGLPSLIKAAWKAFGTAFSLAAFFKIGNDLLTFAGPFLLRKVLQFIHNPDEEMWHGLSYAVAMLVCSIFQTLCINAYFTRVYRVGMNVRASFVGLIYRKTFNLSNKARSKFSVGEIVTHQSVDAQKLQDSITYLHMMWSAPLQIIISMVMLWQLLGVAALIGLLTMIAVMPINYKVAQKMGVFQKELMGMKDKRGKATNEIIQGIRVIKYFAWEASFVNKITDIRDREVSVMRKSAFLRAFAGFFWTATPLLVSTTSFIVFSLLGHDLTAEIAFTSLALFNILRFPLTVAPRVVQSVVESKVSVERVQKYLLAEELDKTAVTRGDSSDYHTHDTDILVKDGTFSWTEDAGHYSLRNINLKIKEGSLVAVVGPVGSGKSTLLYSLLGELIKKQGSVVVNGSMAYASQQPWIRNATLRDNVTFGLEFDKDRYDAALRVCEMNSDLQILPAGDMTEIGEKGINLSGGQKQRVSLARAVYQHSDIYLLDDPLSAVDAHVGQAIFNNCIRDYLEGTTRILVTHQLQYLPYVDHIIVLKKGEIVEMGSYEQLMSHGLDFSSLMTAHVNVASQSEREQAEKERKEKKKAEKKPAAQQQSTEKAASGPTTGAKLMTEEDRLVGSVGLDVYKSYVRSMGYLTGILLVFFYMLDTAVRAVSDWWISKWATDVAAGIDRPTYYIVVYVMISFISLIISLAASIAGVISGLAAAVKIHNTMFQRVLRSPIAFFDTTPIGRILNRFTKDINSIDDALPQTITMALRVSFGVIAPLIIISSVTPFFLVLMLPWTFIYKQIQQYYLRSSRELQRLDSISRSPIFSMLSETITGLVTIRAYGKNNGFVHQNEELVDINQTAYDMTIISNRWLSLNLEVLGALIVFGSAFFAVVERNSIAAGLAGLSITYALNLTSQLNWLVRMSTEIETQMVSVERCQHFQNLPCEAEPIVEPRPEPNWPHSGAITFEHLQMRYRPGLPLVLDDITCKINPREKIGIVGRTGAGKSSFVSILFRMTELDSGRVTIDGLDIAEIGLDDLRSRVAIIPQDPTLFNGTIRSNMDPFDEHKDSELWSALEAVKLHEQVLEMPAKLDAPVTENGENLSVGSRQLLCLARAIVRRPKILVLDEATASVDFDTDALIQKAIRQQFKDVTVLTIAHRINTILDSDRVMVLDKGHLVEFDSPSVLLQNPNSFFYGLVHKSKGVKSVTSSEIVEETVNEPVKAPAQEKYDEVDLT